MKRLSAAAALAILATACGGASDSGSVSDLAAPADKGEVEAQTESDEAAGSAALGSAGERFVRLALAVGQYDENFVDAYHGPAEWAVAAETDTPSLAELQEEAAALRVMVDDALPAIGADDAATLARASMLIKLVDAAAMRIRMANGETVDFDIETQALYDAVAPRYDLADFDAALAEIDALVPGDGPLNERVDSFRNSLAIPLEKLEPVFEAAIAECRRRTLAHYALPETESFRMEFVTDKPWSGYNWYQGDFESLIQINTDLPIIIDRAVDLGCHEGYPGHHTWNVIIERDLLNGKGWIEYSVYPLFSPLSLIAEGSANYGIDLAFPGEEKISFEREVLFPLAGLDPAKAETLNALNKARRRLSHAQNHVAREYLDGRIDRGQATEMLMKYDLSSRPRAEQRVRFIETYRGYVINYNLGRDLVEAAVEAVPAGERWAAFEKILQTPTSASSLEARR